MNTKRTEKSVEIITQIENKSHRRITKLRAYFFCRTQALLTNAGLPTLFILTTLCSSCSSPVQQLQHQADRYSLTTKVIEVGEHSIKSYYSKTLKQKTKNDLVFVYLEGDGRPWAKRFGPNNNPNTHQSIVLPLLAKTKEQGIYLSRPCYGFSPVPENCSPKWWTSHRYSKHVVEEMNEALVQLKKIFNIQKMVLVGHSGGGTLAMLLAKIRSDEKDIAAVITLAGNLDHAAWTDHFNYLPLVGSLNPSDEPQLPPSIIRWHFAGKKDKAVPIELIKKAAKKDSYAKVIELENFDHNCCWNAIWAETVAEIKRRVSKR